MKIKNFLISAVFFGYILGIHGDNIALWKDEDPQPQIVFPYPAASLPRHDQQALQKGIHITTELELTRILEDYLS